MPEIIIVLVMISAVSAIIRAFNKPSVVTQQEKTGDEIFKQYNHIPIRRHKDKGNLTYNAPSQDTKPSSVEISRLESKPKDGGLLESGIRPQLRGTDLTPTRLVEGIILSEIIGAPKSKRFE